jgi:nitroreductase
MKLSELYKQCRTFRRFKQIEIPEQDMDDILNDLRYVHSGNNRQTLSYIAVQSKAKRDAIAKVIKYASLLPRELADPKPEEEAMAYLVIIADAEHSRTVDIDTGIAAEYTVESAFEKGIGSCMMLNFNAQKINEILGLPQNRTAAMVIALGFPSHTSEAVEIGADGSTAYTCDETYHYRVPKKTAEQIAKKI